VTAVANAKIKMSELCDKLKVSQEFTEPHNPEQNGTA
jgi:hypothetical protein